MCVVAITVMKRQAEAQLGWEGADVAAATVWSEERGDEHQSPRRVQES